MTDRATILNFIIGLNGYTVCTGIDNGDLNNEKIVTVPLDTDETMLVGWITMSARSCRRPPKRIWRSSSRWSPATATRSSTDPGTEEPQRKALLPKQHARSVISGDYDSR